MSKEAKKAITSQANRFHEAVLATPDVSESYKPGLQAMGRYSSKVKVANTRLLGGSIDVDESTKNLYPEDSRWDYAFGYAEAAYFVEVHPADTSQTSAVLKKLVWLKSWLKEKAPKIAELRAEEHPYIWIASDSVNILPSSKEYKKLAQSGLKLVGAPLKI
jgi:hypothetical protein